MSEADQRTELGWCVIEIMGHRRLGGFVREQEIAGAGFLRIDVPGEGGAPIATQFYPPASVYCLTPTTETMARAVARQNRPAPVQRWELPPGPDRGTNNHFCHEGPCPTAACHIVLAHEKGELAHLANCAHETGDDGSHDEDEPLRGRSAGEYDDDQDEDNEYP